MHPEDKELFRSYVNDFLAGKVAKVKCRIIHTSGDVRWIESHANPIYKNGEFLKVIGSLTDITEEKISEEILRRSDKLHVIGEMASGVAHEIRNPLTTIKGFMQIIRPKIQEKHYVDTVLTEIERINQIVSEFMALAKPYAANFSPRNVMEMIRDTVNLLRPQLAMNSVQVSLSEETGEAPLVYCEENQIKQVFINIIKNAMEAMPDGGPISISVQRSGRYISIRISDQGRGIESHLLDKVGVPFHTTKENGTGLGLMVSGRIVENHKGSLTIQSVVNQGTTVTIVLPSA
ncbi:PAS domain-containing protein [Paenibacillus sp. P26]|nr:PAS domain-containing protein [Paenibacillus sp. P26]